MNDHLKQLLREELDTLHNRFRQQRLKRQQIASAFENAKSMEHSTETAIQAVARTLDAYDVDWSDLHKSYIDKCIQDGILK